MSIKRQYAHRHAWNNDHCSPQETEEQKQRRDRIMKTLFVWWSAYEKPERRRNIIKLNDYLAFNPHETDQTFNYIESIDAGTDNNPGLTVSLFLIDILRDGKNKA